MVNYKKSMKRLEKKLIGLGLNPIEYLRDKINDSNVKNPSVIIMSPYFYKLLTKEITDYCSCAIGNLNSFNGIQIIVAYGLTHLDIQIY